MVMMSLLPLRLLPRVRPAAAADYFLSNRFMSWFALNIIGIVPVARRRDRPDEDPLAACVQALERGDILIFFPEGTRGEPEKLAAFKSGIARLAKRVPAVPVIPAFMHGLGKALLVPFFCDVFVGVPLVWAGDRDAYMTQLQARMQALASVAGRRRLKKISASESNSGHPTYMSGNL